MRRPLADIRPFGPFVGKEMLSFSNSEREVSHTILFGMERGAAPSMTARGKEFNTTVTDFIHRDTKLDGNNFHVFSEEIVAEPLDNHSVWMTVIKLHKPNLSDQEVKEFADKSADVLDELNFPVEDRTILEGDYFTSPDIRRIE